MKEPDVARNPSFAKSLVFSLAALILVAGLVEAGVWALYHPPARSEIASATAAEEPSPAENPGADTLGVADSSGAAPDLKAGRERAGLGFKDPNMVLHPYLGYVFQPRDPSAEGPFHIAISPEGFLDARSFLRKRSADRRIVGVMGGSVASQLGSFHSERLAQALRRLPAFEGAEPEFVWLGMPGYHQPQQLIQLAWVLSQGGELDYLINLDGFNEVAVPAALNAPQGAHPLFPMNWSMVALDVPDLDVQRTLGAIAFLETERQEREERFRASWRSRSPTGRLLWKLDDDRLGARLSHLAWNLHEYPVEDIPFFVRGPETMPVAAEELVAACVETWKRASLQMHAICAANRIRYLHCLQPNQYDPGSKPLSSEEREAAFDAESPYKPVIEDGYPRFRTAGQELRDAGVAFHDLSQVFADVRETVYVDNCCHFSGLGNALLADAIASAIRESF